MTKESKNLTKKDGNKMRRDNMKIKDSIEVKTRRKSKMEKGLVLKTNIVIERRTKDGKVIDREEVHNMIMNAGKERVAYLLGEGIGTGLTGFSHIAIGTGVTAEDPAQTALVTEVERESASVSYEASYKCVFEKTFDFGTGTSYAITEAGVFDGATVTGSTMLDRFKFSAKNVDVDTDLYVKITITVA